MRIRQLLPGALQVSEDHEPLTGFIATRVENAPDGGRLDVAYPFRLREAEGRMLLAFSPDGADPSLRDEIVAAFIHRIAWWATMFPS